MRQVGELSKQDFERILFATEDFVDFLQTNPEILDQSPDDANPVENALGMFKRFTLLTTNQDIDPDYHAILDLTLEEVGMIIRDGAIEFPSTNALVLKDKILQGIEI